MELEYVGSYLYRGLIIVKISYIGAHRERNISHRYALLSSCRRVSMLDCLRSYCIYFDHTFYRSLSMVNGDI